MAAKEAESIADKLEEISVLIQDAAIPYKGRPAVKPKVKSATSQKAKIRSKANDREASLAEAFDEPTRPPSDTIEQIRLELLKGANLDKQLEPAKIKAELARMQVDSGQPLGASPLLGSSTPKHIKQTTSTSRPKCMEDFAAVPTLSQLRSTEKAQRKVCSCQIRIYSPQKEYPHMTISIFQSLCVVFWSWSKLAPRF